MIKLPKLVEYFKNEVQRSDGVIKNIFLGNGENQIIATSGGGHDEASILSTLFNDSIFIIRLNLLNGEQPSKNEKPLEIAVGLGEKHAFLFSIKNIFLLGVVVDDKNKAFGHKMANDILRYVGEELENIVEWVQNNDVY